jgi:hypothetical protein
MVPVIDAAGRLLWSPQDGRTTHGRAQPDDDRSTRIAAGMKKRRSFNPKRKVTASPPAQPGLEVLAGRVKYGGNPEHKRRPGDFGLTLPAQPRPDKSLCYTTGIFERGLAEDLLRRGVLRGLISERASDAGYPQNIWSVTDAGIPLEAQLENPDLGVYHGYPMPEADPFRHEVLERWFAR